MRLSVKKNALLFCCSRPSKGITENLSTYLITIFDKVQNVKKGCFIIDNFNLGYLNYNEDNKSKSFYFKVCDHGFSLLVDKSKRVRKIDETIIDNNLTNCAFDLTLKASYNQMY